MKMNIILPKKLDNRRGSSYRVLLERELQLQRQLNAELLDKCKIQSQLIDEQSVMISEILTVMGR